MNLVARRLELEVAPGTVTALKWFALALMVVDHLDAFVYGRELGWATQLGRLVMPIFAFVLAYNLARPGTLERGVYPRLVTRLVIAGALAQPFYAQLRGELIPLNILATFAVAAGVIWILELGRRGGIHLAAALFLVGGALVEYAWPGVALVVATWWWLRSPTLERAGVPILALASLVAVNGSHAALWALPVVALATQLRVRLPRAQWAFYAFYPLHLAAFWILAG